MTTTRTPTTTRVRAAVGVAAAAAMLLLSASPALAGPPLDVVRASDAWTCWDEGAPVPPNHCINTRSQGRTGIILVFPPDDRGPAEGISFDPRVADRPCPHDPDAVDGTWWQPTLPDGSTAPFWVCHHKP